MGEPTRAKQFGRRILLGAALLHPANVASQEEPHTLQARKADHVSDVRLQDDNGVLMDKVATDAVDTRQDAAVTEIPEGNLEPLINEITEVFGDQYMVMPTAMEGEQQHVDVLAEGGRTIASIFLHGDDVVIFPGEPHVLSLIDPRAAQEHYGFVVTGVGQIPDVIDALASAGDSTNPQGQDSATAELRGTLQTAAHMSYNEFVTKGADDTTSTADQETDDTHDASDTIDADEAIDDTGEGDTGDAEEGSDQQAQSSREAEGDDE